MNTETQPAPATLMEAVKHYADLDVCHAFMAKIKWPDGVVRCPDCKSENIGMIATRRMFKCRACKHQFSVKVGTIFEDSPLGLDKWFVAVWAITNAKNGISSCELARAIGITQKSAWHMLHRIRHAMHVGSFDKFTGEVETDEAFIGGLAKNMHMRRRKAAGIKSGTTGKAVVHGLLQRGDKASKRKSKVKAVVVPNAQIESVLPSVENSVAFGSKLYSDTAPIYRTDGPWGVYVHEMVDHTKAYVRGRCHTNGLENYWSLLKRTIKGTYVSVDAPHLGRYVDEQMFRFNERETNDAGRFALVMPGVVGKRLTYKTLIGEGSEDRAANGEAENDLLPN